MEPVRSESTEVLVIRDKSLKTLLTARCRPASRCPWVQSTSTVEATSLGRSEYLRPELSHHSNTTCCTAVAIVADITLPRCHERSRYNCIFPWFVLPLLRSTFDLTPYNIIRTPAVGPRRGAVRYPSGYRGRGRKHGRSGPQAWSSGSLA